MQVRGITLGFFVKSVPKGETRIMPLRDSGARSPLAAFSVEKLKDQRCAAVIAKGRTSDGFLRVALSFTQFTKRECTLAAGEMARAAGSALQTYAQTRVDGENRNYILKLVFAKPAPESKPFNSTTTETPESSFSDAFKEGLARILGGLVTAQVPNTRIHCMSFETDERGLLTTFLMGDRTSAKLYPHLFVGLNAQTILSRISDWAEGCSGRGRGEGATETVEIRAVDWKSGLTFKFKIPAYRFAHMIKGFDGNEAVLTGSLAKLFLKSNGSHRHDCEIAHLKVQAIEDLQHHIRGFGVEIEQLNWNDPSIEMFIRDWRMEGGTFHSLPPAEKPARRVLNVAETAPGGSGSEGQERAPRRLVPLAGARAEPTKAELLRARMKGSGNKENTNTTKHTTSMASTSNTALSNINDK